MSNPKHRRAGAIRPVIAVFVILFTVFAATGQAPVARQAPPVSWPRSHNYDVQHYRINVRLDWQKRSVEGETTITLQPYASDLKEIELDAGEMTIKSVKLELGTLLRFRYEGNEKLFVALDREYSSGSNITFTVSYAATPRLGLTFISPNQADPNRPYQIWSQGEARLNHYWFPCYDHPNDRATSEMIVTVDEKYRAISNGSLVSVRDDSAAKTRTWHWKMEQPFSSYLISIIIGDYREIKGEYKGVPVISYVYPHQVEDGKISFGKLPQMVAFFSDKLQFEYPFSKYAQTMAKDFDGAMENITATTMTDTAVHDRRASLDVSSEDIVSHELAHTWFGNTVTCEDWSQLWLNESFATFMESVWSEHDRSKDDYFYEMHKNQQTYFQTWAQGIRRPVVTMRYIDPDSLFDTYTYPRGAAVVNMMRFLLGEELFWKALRHYIKKNQWQMVETQTLIESIEESTGQNLQQFIDQWVYKMGHPEFEIASRFDDRAKKLRLTVRQTQKADSNYPWFESPEFFVTPVDIAITTSSGERVHRVLIDKKEIDFTFDVDSKPLIINFDRGNYIIKQMKFPVGDDMLAYQLLYDSDVTGRLRAAIQLGASRSETAVSALTQAATRDSFWGIRLESTKALSLLHSAASRAALLEAVKDKDSRIRREAIEGLAVFEDSSLADLYRNLIESDQSYFVVAEAAKALGKSRAPQSFETLAALLGQDSWQDTIRAGALVGFGALKDTRALDFAFMYAAPGNSASVRGAALALLGITGRGNERAYRMLIEVLGEPSIQIRFIAIQALGELGDSRAIPVLEDAAKKNDMAFARQFIGFAIYQIREAAKQRGR